MEKPTPKARKVCSNRPHQGLRPADLARRPRRLRQDAAGRQQGLRGAGEGRRRACRRRPSRPPKKRWPRPRPGWPASPASSAPRPPGGWGKLENIFEERVARALEKLGMPSAARSGGAAGARRGARGAAAARQDRAASAARRAAQDAARQPPRPREAVAAAQAEQRQPDRRRPRCGVGAARSIAPRAHDCARVAPGDNTGATPWPRKRHAALRNASSKPRSTCSTASGSRTSRPRWSRPSWASAPATCTTTTRPRTS